MNGTNGTRYPTSWSSSCSWCHQTGNVNLKCGWGGEGVMICRNMKILDILWHSRYLVQIFIKSGLLESLRVHGFDNRTMGGVSWAMLGCSGTLKNLRPCMPCSRNVWPVKSCSWRHLVLLTLSWSIMTCQPSTNRDVFLFASSCYPLAKPSGETLKLLAVSVPSTKEQNSQETNSSFPADDSPSALGPFFSVWFRWPSQAEKRRGRWSCGTKCLKNAGLKHDETCWNLYQSWILLSPSMISWLSQKNPVSWLDLVGIVKRHVVVVTMTISEFLSTSGTQKWWNRYGASHFPMFSPPFVAWWCHSPEALGKGQARDSGILREDIWEIHWEVQWDMDIQWYDGML